MVIKICPHCNNRYIVMNDCDDYIHECNSGNTTLDQEDIVIVSQTIEEFGSTVTTKKPTEIMYQGIENEFFGTRAALEGENFDGVTERGVNTKTHRQRQHYEYIETKQS